MAKRSRKPKPAGPDNTAGKRAALIAAVVIVIGVGLVVVLSPDRDDDGADEAVSIEQIVDLVPEPLAGDEIHAAAGEPGADGVMPDLDAGGWIQIVDRDTGKLAQQYRFARLDPTPEGLPANWVRMDEPRADLYLANNRVVRLSGDSALVHLPHRVLESGSLTGNVLIEVFEPPPDRMLDDERDDPVLVVHAPEAAFDNVMGEVTCPDRFRVESPSLEFLGHGLSLLVNDQAEPVSANMEIAKLEFARFAQAPVEEQVEEPAETPPATAAQPPATADAGSPASEPGDAAPDEQTPPAEAVQHYQLTLRDNVKIQEGIGTRVVTGDTLVVMFTSESEGFTAVASPASSPPTTGSPAASIPAWIAATAITQPGAGDADTRQRLSSRYSDRSIAPPIRDNDIYVTCTGGLSLVPVDDPERLALLESPRDSWMTLTGTPVELVDRTHDARAVCDRIVFRGLEQTIRLLGSEAQPLTVTAPQMDAAGKVFWIRRGAAGFDGPGWLSSAQAGDSDAEQVRLTWTNGLDLGFDETSAGALGNLRQAVFRGDVVARSEESTLACTDRLVLDLATDDRGATAPTLLTAIGEVRASDPEQTMWSDRLEVTFLERHDAPASGVASAGGALPVATLGSGSRVDEFTATGDVQVLLADGARVFADRLHGNAAREAVKLSGADIAIANKQWLIDEGREIALDKASGTALWNGPGVARVFGSELPVGTDDRVDRSVLDLRHQSRATWNGSMRYTDATGEGDGLIDLTGGVEMVSEPDPLQRTTFSGEHVTIELADRAAGGDVDRAAIGKVIATGDARLEQRRWITEAHADEPRIFFVSGERLEYDEAAGEALVPGPGELLIRDLRRSESGDENAAAFGARGTTSFRWTTRLQMTRSTDTLYDIAMVDGIEMRHLDLAGESMTLTCNRIDATIDRPQTGEMEGPADLQHVRAAGEVFLRAPTRDVDCDLFDYNVREGYALITANPGRVVTIFTRGAPQPITLRSARWNLATDEMTATKGTGGGTR